MPARTGPAAGCIARWRPSSVPPEAAAFARDVIGQVAPDGQVRHEGYLRSLCHRHVMKWGGYRSSIAKTKAIIVVAHAILVIIWHVLATGTPYDELGADFFTRRLDPGRKPAASSQNSKPSATRSASNQPPDTPCVNLRPRFARLPVW